MNLFGLAIRSVWRKKTRSVILFIIVYVLTDAFYAGFASEEANVKIRDSGRQTIGASFRLEVNGSNRKKWLEELSRALDEQVGENSPGSLGGYNRKQLDNGSWMVWTDNSFDTLKLGDIEKIAAVPGIASYNITTANTVVNLVNANRIEDADVDQSTDPGGISLRGNLRMDMDFDVAKGNITVTEGRMITPEDENVCVISRELANYNSLEIGDKLLFNNWKEVDTSEIFQAEIIGIYDSEAGITPITSGDSYRAENIIFTDLSFPEKAEGCEGNPLYQYASFQVEDVNEYEAVKERIKAVDVDWEYYDLWDNNGLSEVMAENFGELKNMAEMLLILSFVSAVIILIFIFHFWMKNRTHEIGILLSIGRTRPKIVFQMLTEGLLIGCVAFALATASAGEICDVAANYLVGTASEISEQQATADEGLVAASEEASKSEAVGVSVDLNAKTIGYTAASVIGSIALAVGFSSISVVIQEPRDILSKMR